MFIGEKCGNLKTVVDGGELTGNINPFVPSAPLLNPLKTSENLTVFWCFQGVEKECIGNKWVNRKKKSDVLQGYKCPLCDKCYRRD